MFKLLKIFLVKILNKLKKKNEWQPCLDLAVFLFLLVSISLGRLSSKRLCFVIFLYSFDWWFEPIIFLFFFSISTTKSLQNNDFMHLSFSSLRASRS